MPKVGYSRRFRHRAVANSVPAPALPPFPHPPVVVAVSECLTGANVRYDGGHRRGAWPMDALAGLFCFKPICPEVGIGMGVPRAPIRLVGNAAAPRAVGVVDASVDVTAALQGHAAAQATVLDEVDGYVFKARSPSCGVFAVPVHDAHGRESATTGRGVFAAQVMRQRPNLPVEEGERLADGTTRAQFLMRVLIHAHWRNSFAGGITAARLIAFHSGCKYLVMAHSPIAYRRLGRLLADLSGDTSTLGTHYFRGLMETLAQPATRGGHANALAHLQGYLKRRLPGAERRELAAAIEGYRRGETPLAAPLSLLARRLREQEVADALGQYYLRVYAGVDARAELA